MYVVDKGNDRVEYFSETGVFVGEFSGGETPAKAFLAPAGIAVDNACQLHKPVLTEATNPTCKAFDPSAGDVYVEDGPQKVIDKFSSTGVYVGQITETSKGVSLGQLRGIAVDPRGELWVAQDVGGEEQFDTYSDAVANEFRESRLPESFDGLGGGLAVDSEDDLYVRNPDRHVTEYETKENLPPRHFATRINEHLDSEASQVGANGVAVEQSTDQVYIDNVGSVGRFGSGLLSMSPSERGLPIERFGSGVLSEGTGIAVNSANGRVYVAEGSTGEVQDYSLEPPASPIVQSDWASDVTATSATFSTEINPRSEPNEPPTAYRFEYGPCSSPSTCPSSAYEHSVPVPDGQLAPNYELDTASTGVQGLSAGTTYHFRVVAENKISKKRHEPVVGGEKIVTTQFLPGAFVLADERVWELVSPAEKLGALLLPLRRDFAVQAAAGGGSVSYVATAPTEPVLAGNGPVTQVLSSRLSGGGWVSRDLALPHARALGAPLADFPEYPLFSPDLALAIVQPLGVPLPCSPEGPGPQCLSEEASEQTAFLRSDFVAGNPGRCLCAGCFRALLSSACDGRERAGRRIRDTERSGASLSAVPVVWSAGGGCEP